MAILNNSNAISVAGAYDVNNSLRIRASASAFLNRTPGTTGNQKTFTWSGWVKRGVLGSQQMFHHAFYGDSGRYASIYFTSSDTLVVQSGIYTTGASTTTSYNYITTQVFRDPSAWYHIVLAVDTTQATSGNRVKVYVNGSQITAFGTSTAPSQNDNTFFNITTSPMYIGKYAEAPGGSFLDGYLAEVNWIDGQALTPSSFGETDTTTGSWKPKAYTGTYGTNGFYLKFSDIATTSGSNAGLGKDFSGNGNYYNTNNISVTAGTTYDAMIDSPTLTSATVANYCVLNPLNKNTNVTVSNANLTSTSAVSNAGISGTMYVKSSGKYYWEATCTTKTTYPIVGIVNEAWSSGTNALTYPGATSGSYGYANDGLKYNNGSTASYGASYTSGDIIGVALDLDAGTLTFYKNNTSQGTAYTGLTDSYAPSVSGQASDVWNMNFGQRPFSYTPPTGFVALNTFNLPDSTIKKGNTVMDAVLYNGQNSSQSVTGVNFQPDMVWIKPRNVVGNNTIYDAVRGVTKLVFPNSTNAESTYSGGLTSFDANGFSLAYSADSNFNVSGYTYVGWVWDANGAGSSNTSGSITSTVSVNTTAGFSIVTYTGTGANATVGHGLGVAPAMYIVKRRNGGANNWRVYHRNMAASPATGTLYLSLTDAFTVDSSEWNNTAPTSSVISLGTQNSVNGSGGTFVAYCWAEIAGFSKFGSYTGNGSTDGPFVYTGFRPKFILVKITSSVADWIIWDSARNTFNVTNSKLSPNTSGAEYTDTAVVGIDFLSNGFKLKGTDTAVNTGAANYIYMAFAENPLKNSLAR